MALIEKITYQLKKYKFRNIKLPPVNNLIFSENSSEHWQHLAVENMNVLDLGFGRWGVSNLKETSPVYFKSKKANRIIGVDCNREEVEFFSEYFKNNFRDESIFINKYINHPDVLTDLIDRFKIDSIKCDIEGAEIHLYKLTRAALSNIKYISIEYHSPGLLKELIHVNNTSWNFNIIDHSIFSDQFYMGVVTLKA